MHRAIRVIREDRPDGEIVLGTYLADIPVSKNAWFETVLNTYEEVMDWHDVPITEVDVQGGADEVLVEVVVSPMFARTIDLVVERHVATLERIRANVLSTCEGTSDQK